jgi:hypothetical protein
VWICGYGRRDLHQQPVVDTEVDRTVGLLQSIGFRVSERRIDRLPLTRFLFSMHPEPRSATVDALRRKLQASKQLLFDKRSSAVDERRPECARAHPAVD